jgi:hypothetical protein
VWLPQNRRKPRESQQKYVFLWHYVFANLPHPSQSFQQFAPDTQVATVEDQSKVMRRRLTTLADGFDVDGLIAAPAGPMINPGSRLIRECHGRTHTV